jgi:hypothetical protein
MKKVIFGIIVLSLIFTTSCKKNTNPGGSWTFKSTTYSTTICVGDPGQLSASNGNASNNNTYSMLYVYFYTAALPTTAGTYTVAYGNAPNSASQVGIELTTGGNANDYSSTGGNGTQTVSVTVSNGKVSISGSGIMMYNTVNPSDSSALNFNITQLQ